MLSNIHIFLTFDWENWNIKLIARSRFDIEYRITNNKPAAYFTYMINWLRIFKLNDEHYWMPILFRNDLIECTIIHLNVFIENTCLTCRFVLKCYSIIFCFFLTCSCLTNTNYLLENSTFVDGMSCSKFKFTYVPICKFPRMLW